MHSSPFWENSNSYWSHLRKKLPSNCQIIRISFKGLQEAVDELMKAPKSTYMYSSPIFGNFYSYWSLLWKNYLLTVWQSLFPSRAFKKQLTSRCGLPHPQLCTSHIFWGISLGVGHFCGKITFKLSDNHDFLQEPSRSSWRAAAASHAHNYVFLTSFGEFH